MNFLKNGKTFLEMATPYNNENSCRCCGNIYRNKLESPNPIYLINHFESNKECLKCYPEIYLFVNNHKSSLFLDPNIHGEKEREERLKMMWMITPPPTESFKKIAKKSPKAKKNKKSPKAKKNKKSPKAKKNKKSNKE
jgi:hypothetical protein